MSLKLYAPGTRGNSKFYYVRGSINGQRYEFSTQTADKAAAERLKVEFEAKVLNNALEERCPTFRYAAESYIAWRNPSVRDGKQLQLIIRLIGNKLVKDVVQADLVKAADIIFPNGKAGNKNRWVMRIGAAVLHHAARNNWCVWQRIQLFKEPRPVTRATTLEVAQKLIKGADKPIQKLFLLWLFKHGDRVTDVCKIEWEKINFDRATYDFYQHKNDRWRTAVLDEEVLQLLTEIRQEAQDENGDLPKFLFPWSSRHSAYKWITPLKKRLGVTFTPHMARHTVGTML